eukprot:Nitzschia sp. Nitz4//scaffold115_size69933//717//1409//NITZ4_005993-RA/size69933-processed-gene-0.49-mRNA-1//1//CDS//3329533472//8925//frame0
MQTSTISVQELNNLGCQCLETERYTEAVTLLSAAFQRSQACVNTLEISVNMEAAILVDYWMTRTEMDEDFSSDSFVYTHPVYLKSKIFEIPVVTYTVIVSFNLALAYHMVAERQLAQMQQPGNSKKFTYTVQQLKEQALQLYQFSFRLQRAQARSSHSPLYFMACINNIGVLFMDLGEFVKGGECFNHLMALLMYMNAIGGSDPSDFSSFFQNSWRMCIESQCTLGAAAA